MSLVEKVFYVEADIRNRKFVLRIFGKHVAIFIKYFIMSFCTQDHTRAKISPDRITFRRITTENIGDFDADDFPFEDMNDRLRDGWEGFGIWTHDGQPIGSSWLQYGGGRHICFNFKTIEAYIGAVFISEKFRRKGYCEYMLSELLRYLHERRNINTAHLVVQSGNYPARHLYKKLGGKEEFSREMIRVCKIPIPIHGYDL